MKKSISALMLLLLSISLFSQLTLISGEQRKTLSIETLNVLPMESFETSYESYLANDGVSPKKSTYEGVRLSFLLNYVGAVKDSDVIYLIASDGYFQAIPKNVCDGFTALGIPFIAIAKNGKEGIYFAFKTDDGLIENTEMHRVLGDEFSKYREGILSASGMQIKGLEYVVVNWNGDLNSLKIPDKNPGIADSESLEKGDSKSVFNLSIKGLEELSINDSDFSELIRCEHHCKNFSLEEKGQKNDYSGIPLKSLIAAVDGGKSSHPYIFDEDLWKKGYEVTMTSKDGYSVTFDSSEYDPDKFYLAFAKNGEKITPMITGDISGKLKIKDITEIELSIAESEYVIPEIILKLVFSGQEISYTLDELENSTYFFEEEGQFTTSAGSVYKDIYSGINMASFLKDKANLETGDTLKITASDGYRMDFGGKEILNPENGIWMLAFKMNGEYLPEDPGYFRTIKVGKDVDTEGHNSVKMVSEFEIIKSEYVDFSLEFEGLMNLTIDRDTIQSGVNCHKTTVECEVKGNVDEYEGIALWRLLAYSDDPNYAPHRQDSEIISYNEESASRGYEVEIVADDGYSIKLDSKQLHRNDDVIIALLKNGKEPDEKLWPMVLAWNSQGERIPDGIKMVKRISKIVLTNFK